jgi:osmotically-inducible protein OsmY
MTRRHEPKLGTDERIWEEVHDQLMEHPDLDSTGVEIEVEEGVVVLTGRVENREAKWLAEEVARSVPGVMEVQNKLKAARASGW